MPALFGNVTAERTASFALKVTVYAVITMLAGWVIVLGIFNNSFS